jgi:methylphosphotriester-DNA--protein-cysteine methyltransferase
VIGTLCFLSNPPHRVSSRLNNGGGVSRYLAEPGLYLSQIAVLLGYSEQSALNRSCRRWFGKTPRQYRAGLPVSP